MYDYAGF